MISRLQGLPAGVIGFEASGKIAAEDYRDVVVPDLQQAACHRTLRLDDARRNHDIPARPERASDPMGS